MTKQSFAWVSRITKAMVEIAIVLDINCSAFPLTWEFSIVSAEGKSCKRSAPSVCHQGVNKVTLVIPWCDMCTFPLPVELCVKIGGFEMAYEGVSSERKCFFFLFEGMEIYFSWTLSLLNFLLYSFHLWKTLSLLLPHASFSKISTANASICSRDFILLLNGIRTAAFEVLWHSLI